MLPLATNQLMGDNKEFDIKGIFWGVLLIVGGGEYMTMEDPSLTALGYQLLALATSQLMDDNREFDVSCIFWGVLLIVGGGEHMTIEDPSRFIMIQNMPFTSNSLLSSHLLTGC